MLETKYIGDSFGRFLSPTPVWHMVDEVYVLEHLICSISFDFEHHVNSIIPLKSK